jgi:hypothetical protein
LASPRQEWFLEKRFTQGTNHTLSAQGATFTANGPATIDHSNLSALSGGTINLPGATSYDGTGPVGFHLNASGANSTIDLSHVTSFKGADGVNDDDIVHVETYAGGTIDLSQLAQIGTGAIGFYAENANSQIKLTALNTFAGAGQRSSYLWVRMGGTIWASALSNLNFVDLRVDTSGMLPTDSVTTFTRGNASVFGGATLAFPALTTFTAIDVPIGLSAQDENSKLDLSHVTALKGNNRSIVYVSALRGGTVDLSHVAQIDSGNASFRAQGVSSQINLSDLTSFTGAIPEVSFLSVVSGGAITAPALSSLKRIKLELAGGGTLPANRITSFVQGSAYVYGDATLALPALTIYDDTSTGSSFHLLASGTNSKLDLSHVTTFLGPGSDNDSGICLVEAAAGGMIDLGQVGEIHHGRSSFYAQDANSQIRLTVLTSFSGGGLGYSSLWVKDGGTIMAPALTSVGRTVLEADNSRFVLSALTSLSASQIKVSSGGAINLTSGTTEAVGVDVVFSNSGTISTGTLHLDWRSSLIDGSGGVTSGTLDSNLSNEGQMQTLNAGDLLTITGSYTQSPGYPIGSGSLTGPGTVNVNGRLTWAAGDMAGSGVTNANGGLSISGDGLKTLDGHTLNDGGDGSWTGGGYVMIENSGKLNLLSGASLDIQNDRAILGAPGTGSVTNGGTLLKSAGTFTTTIQVPFVNNHIVEVRSGTLDLTGGFANFDGANLTSGTYDVLGTFQFTGAKIVGNAATLILDGPNGKIVDEMGNNALSNFATNTATGSFTLQNGAQLTVNTEFTNAGTMTIGAASSFETALGYTQTAGSTTLQNGTIIADSTMINLQGGVLSGTGTLNGNVTNAAEIDVGTTTDPGVITINGDYSQPGGTLVLKIGGLNPGTDFDQLLISGQAAFAGGTLTIRLINGFVPDPSNPDMFEIIDFGMHDPTDDFSTYNGTDLGNGLTLVPQFDTTSLTLVATQM